MKLNDDLIARWVAGRLSADEEAELEALSDQDPLIRKQLDEIRYIWTSSGKSLLDREAHPKSSNAQIVHRDYQPKTVSKTKWYWGVAATLLVAMVTHSWWSNREEMITVSTGNNETMAVLLPDSSSLILNANSSVEYERVHFVDRRRVSMTGEVLYKVRRNKTPFQVVVGAMLVDVLGTTFNVRARGNRVQVACAEGSVGISAGKHAERRIVVRSGRMVDVVNGAEPGSPVEIDLRQVGSWKESETIYHQTPLRWVVEDLQYRYGVKLQPWNDNMLIFTGRLPPDLAGSLNILSRSTGLHFMLNDDSSIVIRK